MPPQSSLSAADIKQKLVGYTRVPANGLSKIVPGDRVRYMSQGNFRGGGSVKINKFPDYLVLVNLNSKASWCMQIKDPTLKVWNKSMKSVLKEKTEKDKIYALYKSGQLCQT